MVDFSFFFFFSSVKILWLFSVEKRGVHGGFTDTTYDMKCVLLLH